MEIGKKPHLVACGILKTEIELLRSLGEIDVTVQYLNRRLHSDYGRLYAALDNTLNKVIPKASGGAVVVYGDVCLGFDGEMAALIKKHGVIKVDGLNCIDCLLGGGGKLLDMDPEHKMLFLNPAFIDFMERIWAGSDEEIKEMFSMLNGIILLDAMGDLHDYTDKIAAIARKTALPILERKDIGLGGLKSVLQKALKRNGA